MFRVVRFPALALSILSLIFALNWTLNCAIIICSYAVVVVVVVVEVVETAEVVLTDVVVVVSSASKALVQSQQMHKRMESSQMHKTSILYESCGCRNCTNGRTHRWT